MPVRPFAVSRSKDYPKLVKQLTTEWKTANSKASEPVILEEKDKKGVLVHVYVIWDVWNAMDRAERGEIIMDAAEKAKEPEEVMNITIAMGLTSEEADRFGLNWRQ